MPVFQTNPALAELISSLTPTHRKGIDRAKVTRRRPRAGKSYLRVCENWVVLWPLYVQSASSGEAAEHGK